MKFHLKVFIHENAFENVDCKNVGYFVLASMRLLDSIGYLKYNAQRESYKYIILSRHSIVVIDVCIDSWQSAVLLNYH